MTKKEDMKKLHQKSDQLQKTIDELNARLIKHIEFIDKTYAGLKNPIAAARKWFKR